MLFTAIRLFNALMLVVILPKFPSPCRTSFACYSSFIFWTLLGLGWLYGNWVVTLLSFMPITTEKKAEEDEVKEMKRCRLFIRFTCSFSRKKTQSSSWCCHLIHQDVNCVVFVLFNIFRILHAWLPVRDAFVELDSAHLLPFSLAMSLL